LIQNKKSKSLLKKTKKKKKKKKRSSIFASKIQEAAALDLQVSFPTCNQTMQFKKYAEPCKCRASEKSLKIIYIYKKKKKKNCLVLPQEA